MADYINYGDLQIEQLALLNNLSDNVYKYVLRQPWSNKKKEKFMSAYQDIISRGVLGASNSTGEWRINVGGNVMPTMDKKDREMYEEAAYFIQLLMAGLPTKASEELAKEKEKSELPTFDNDAFTTDFRKYISSTRGGQSFVIDNKWNNLDLKRNEKGERERTERTKKLLGYLEGYKSKFDSSKYSFKDSPFENDADFKLRLDKAIQALKSPELSDDNDALMSLGLNPEDWFNNGTGDIYTGNKEFNLLYNGLGTYGLYYNEYLPALLELKNKQLLLVELEKKLNQYTRYQFYGAKPGLAARIGTPIRSEYRGRELDYLRSLATKSDLTEQEVDELIGGFRLFEQQGKLSRLSKEELEKFGPSMKNRANNLKKIEGLEGFYWDPIVLRIVRPINENVAPLIIDSLSIFDLNSPEQKRINAGNRRVNDGEWLTEDYLRMSAMALDIAGTVAAFLPGYGTAASAGLGITSLGTNMAADIADDSVSTGLVAKNAAINLGLGVIGLVPGLGIAGKSGKWITLLAKWTPRILTLAAAGDIALDEDVLKSLAKINSDETLTVNDWKNVGYALSTIAGLSRGARGIVDHRKYSPAFKLSTKTETFITTKSGKKIPATKDQVDKINKAGRKGGNEEANKELRKIPGAENEEINIDFKTGIKGRIDLKNKIKLDENTTSISVSPRLQAYLRALRILNGRRKSGQGIYKFAPKFLPTSYDIYSGAARLLLPQWNILNRVKEAWDPVGKSRINTGKTKKQSINNILSLPNKNQPVPNSPLFPEKNWALETSLDIHRPIQQSYKKTKLDTFPKYSKEIDKFDKAYFKGESMGKSGYGNINYSDPSKSIKPGELSFIINGETIKFKVTKEELKNASPSKINEIRLKFAKLLLKLINTTPSKEMGPMLLKLKEQGFLKQGGRIDKLKIQIYKNYLKNENKT